MKAPMKVNEAEELCQNRNMWRDIVSAYLEDIKSEIVSIYVFYIGN